MNVHLLEMRIERYAQMMLDTQQRAEYTKAEFGKLHEQTIQVLIEMGVACGAHMALVEIWESAAGREYPRKVVEGWCGQ